ncbi:RNHCP domain-containing protein [Patescibacteria group bacterium]|nr:RNHCP domain-containing protein [Patescibacteria group bacterium]
MHIRKNMIQNNEGFVCQKCRIKVEPHPGGSCRNHCSFCLYSLHVDLDVPGDRANECKGLMKPIGIELNKKKGTRIIHMCQECAHKSYNRTAPDDNFDLICELSKIPQ